MQQDVQQRAQSGLGQVLKAAREKRGTTLSEAAGKLRVDVAVLEALEGERFDELGAPVFVRGHLRHYAELLGEAPDAITLVDGPSHADEVEIGVDEKVVWLSQTTLSVDETIETVERLRLRLHEALQNRAGVAEGALGARREAAEGAARKLLAALREKLLGAGAAAAPAAPSTPITSAGERTRT
jgi:hypothetical protein